MIILEQTTATFEDISTRTAKIIIGQNNITKQWTVGGLPVDGDLKPVLESRFNELWMAAQNGPEVDFLAWSLDYLITWRDNRRNGLTESMYYEAQRWQAAPDTPFGLDSQRGRMSQEQYAAWVIKTWTKIEADYSLAVSLVKQSRTVEEIELILSRRI